MALKGMIESTKSLRVAITHECPLHCRACYSIKKDGSMDFPLFIKLLDEGEALGFNNVAFGGGEPLVDVGRFEQFARAAKERGYTTAVTSSGYKVTASQIKKLAEAGLDFFQISAGFNRVVVKGVFTEVKASGIDFGVNFLVDKRYINEIPRHHEAFQEWGASYVVYIMPKSMQDETDDLKFAKDDVVRYLTMLAGLKKTSSLPFLVDCSTSMFEGHGCPGIEHGISIDPEGRVSFCAFCNDWVPYRESLATTISDLNEKCAGTCKCLDKFLTAYPTPSNPMGSGTARQPRP